MAISRAYAVVTTATVSEINDKNCHTQKKVCRSSINTFCLNANWYLRKHTWDIIKIPFTMSYTFLLVRYSNIILSRTTPTEHAWNIISAKRKRKRKKLFFLLSRAFFLCVMLMKSFLLVICRFELSSFFNFYFKKTNEE